MKIVKRLLTLFLVMSIVVLTGCSNKVKDTEAAIAAITAAENSGDKSTAITAAEELYNALEDNQKEKVTNASVLRVAQAESAIDRIGYVSEFAVFQPLNAENRIGTANSAYNRLNAEEKKQVSNYAALTEASELLADAKATKDGAQAYAEKLFASCAKHFKRSDSIQLKRAWCHATGLTTIFYDFTFEFEWKNAYGITETVYYGNSLSIMDLDEKSISLASTGLVLGSANLYFVEGETDAMDNEDSIQLDAHAIQSYFRRNR